MCSKSRPQALPRAKSLVQELQLMGGASLFAFKLHDFDWSQMKSSTPLT